MSEYFKETTDKWISLASGIGSIILAIIAAIIQMKESLISVPFWLGAYVMLIVSVYWAWRNQFRMRVAAEDKLKPRLEIVGVPELESVNNIWRIRVKNHSSINMKVRASVEKMTPCPYALPAPLIVTGGGRESFEIIIPGLGTGLFDVFWHGGDIVNLYTPNHSITQYSFRHGRYELEIVVYSDTGVAERRDFTFIFTKDEYRFWAM